MRTTIDMTDDQRARLLDLAARRGLKGYSAIVKEALDAYLRSVDARSSEVQAALSMRGALTGAEADDLAQATARIRETWR